MKSTEADTAAFLTILDRRNLMPLKTVHMSQMILVLPYALMFWILASGASQVKDYSPLMTAVTSVYAPIWFVFSAACRIFLLKRISGCNDSCLEKLRTSLPEHAGKSKAQLQLLVIQKSMNIFYALLDAYSLPGVIMLISAIRGGVKLDSIFPWINILPMVFTVIHAALNYPDAGKISELFRKTTVR